MLQIAGRRGSSSGLLDLELEDFRYLKIFNLNRGYFLCSEVLCFYVPRFAHDTTEDDHWTMMIVDRTIAQDCQY